MAVYKDKKRNSWYVDIRYRDEMGEIKSIKKRGFELKRDAEAWEIDYRRSHQGAFQKYMFLEMANIYLDSRKGYANAATLDGYKQKISDYMKALHSISLPISPKRLLRWQLELEQSDLATRTKNDIINLLKSISRFAYRYYDIKDTAKQIEPFQLTFEDKKEKRVIGIDEFNKLIEHVTNPTVKIYLEFLYFTGCRRSEAKAVLKDDIDIKHKTVAITKSIPHRNKGDRKQISSLKTPKSHRVLKLDDALFESITPLLNQEGPFLFGGHEPLANSTIDRHFKKALSDARLPKMTLHELRHSNGSLLLDAGVPLIVVSKRLGHASVDVTARVYAHAMQNIDERSAEVINILRKK